MIDLQDLGMETPRYSFDKEKHIHLLNNKPLYGTTTVLSVIAKPLTWWASGLAVKELSGIEDTSIFTKMKNRKATPDEIANAKDSVKLWLDDHKDMDVDTYLPLLDKAYRAHSIRLEETAQAGTDLHYELERYVEDMINGSSSFLDYDEKIRPFIGWASTNVKRFLWSEGYCYSERLWVGGICDVGVELNNGQIGIMDFKSAKAVYPSHYFQDAGYDILISENGIHDINGKRIYMPDRPFDFYSVVPFGAKEVIPQFNYDLDGCKNAFVASLNLYKELQKFQE